MDIYHTKKTGGSRFSDWNLCRESHTAHIDGDGAGTLSQAQTTTKLSTNKTISNMLHARLRGNVPICMGSIMYPASPCTSLLHTPISRLTHWGDEPRGSHV